MKEDYIKSQFHEDVNVAEVARYAKCRQPYVKQVWIDTYGREAFDLRKRGRYRSSKLGDKNPKIHRVGPAHHNYKDVLSSTRGYVRVRTPEWYTGPSSDGYAREHVLIYCAANGVTELPEGMEIHHLDENKTNNAMSNLIMLTTSDHAKLHVWMNKTLRATTIPKGSRDDGTVPKRTASEKSEDDIV